MKITRRLLFVPLLLALFFYLFFSAYQSVKDRALNEFNTQQFALARQGARGIESFFNYYQRELLFLSDLKDISDLNDQGKSILSGFYKNHSAQIEAITYVDAKGVLVYTFPYNETVMGRNISGQEHIKSILATHKPTVSDVFTAVQGFRAIAYHVPVIRGNEYVGSLAILIPLDKLGKIFIENIRTGETGYGSMISEEGIELFNPVRGEGGISVKEIYKRYPTVLNLFERILREKEGTAICYMAPPKKENEKLSKTIAAFYRVTLNNTFWTILIFTPEKEVFANLASFRNRLYILFTLILLVIGTYFFLALKAGSVITEEKKRRELEKILYESEKRSQEKMLTLSRALESIGECVSITDLKNEIIFVNSAFCKTYGFEEKELIGNNISVVRSFNTEGKLGEQILADTLQGGWNGEVINKRKDGSEFPIELSTSSIKDENGNPVALIGIAVDITDRKKSQKELILSKEKAEESDRLKSAFLANMSHELRTPLNAIVGFSSLMTETSNNPETISYSKIILDSGQHLLRLVEDILDTSMIEIGQFKINYEKAGVHSLLSEVKNILLGERIKEDKNNIKIILELDQEISEPYIYTDIRKVKQVLINLLKNSLKFTDEGYIEFGYSEIDKAGTRYIRFFVKDTGIGIDEKYHEIIFNIFRQIDDTRTRKYGGAGIGLSVAKKIVELLGGEIWLESQSGKGSVFYFTVPRVVEARKTEFRDFNTSEMNESKFSGKTILVVEDEVTSYEFLRIFFTNLDIRVLWAKNGVEAVNLCDTDPTIDLVLMDIKMPVMNGYEATKKIKVKRPELPVIAQTAYATLADKQEALESGCDDYLSKPIQIKQLKEMISKYF